MKNTDMVIFCGQSNMQGQTEKPPADISAVEGAFEYRYLTKELVPLKHPVGESISHNEEKIERSAYKTTEELLANAALLSPVDDNANMVPSFCKSYIAETGRNIVAVHTAKGSTTIDYWQKGEKGYKMVYKKVKAAIEASNPEHIYFAWLQGESDAIEGKSKEQYKEKILQLNEALKKDLNVEKFGIILVGRFTMDDRDFEIINAQKEVCEENDDFLMLTTITEELITQKEYLHPTVRAHYVCKGQEKIGTLAGSGLGKYINGR